MHGKQRFFEEVKSIADITHLYNPIADKIYINGRYRDNMHQISNYGEAHLQGRRNSQEDASLFVQLTTPLLLTPQQVAERLWSTIKIVDNLVNTEGLGQNEGTTACVACLHQGHLITANLADTVVFALLVNTDGKLLGVTRLTENLHHPDDQKELKRIHSQGGIVIGDRVNDDLAVARAIGDYKYNEKGNVIIADASIGIYSLSHLQTVLNPHNESSGELKFIMTCDGFTEAADILQKEHHKYLKTSFDIIKEQTFCIELNESYLALTLARKALDDQSGDNISVSVLTYDPAIANPCYFGIFDGHGGQKIVDLVVTNFITLFNEQLGLTEEAYQQQSFSTHNNQTNYLRDNESIIKNVSPDKVANDEPIIDFNLTFNAS